VTTLYRRDGPAPSIALAIGSLFPFRPHGKRYTEEQLTAMRGGLTVEKYRAKFLKKWGKR
jgi:hypothetical protein